MTELEYHLNNAIKHIETAKTITQQKQELNRYRVPLIDLKMQLQKIMKNIKKEV